MALSNTTHEHWGWRRLVPCLAAPSLVGSLWGGGEGRSQILITSTLRTCVFDSLVIVSYVYVGGQHEGCSWRSTTRSRTHLHDRQSNAPFVIILSESVTDLEKP